jgi:hypothetical protein
MEETQRIVIGASFTRKIFCRSKMDHYEEVEEFVFVPENCM